MHRMDAHLQTAQCALAVYKRLDAGLARQLPAADCAQRVDLVEESLAEVQVQLELASE